MPAAPVVRNGLVAFRGFPNPASLRAVVRRSAGIWLLARLAYVAVLMAGVAFFGLMSYDDGVASALHPVWPTRPVLVAVTAFLVWWDRRRFREVLFDANLGTHPGWFLAASLLTASAMDLVVQTLIGVL